MFGRVVWCGALFISTHITLLFRIFNIIWKRKWTGVRINFRNSHFSNQILWFTDCKSAGLVLLSLIAVTGSPFHRFLLVLRTNTMPGINWCLVLTINCLSCTVLKQTWLSPFLVMKLGWCHHFYVAKNLVNFLIRWLQCSNLLFWPVSEVSIKIEVASRFE